MKIENAIELRHKHARKRPGRENDLMKYYEALCALKKEILQNMPYEYDLWVRVAISVVRHISRQDMRLSVVDIVKLHRLLDLPEEIIYT